MRQRSLGAKALASIFASAVASVAASGCLFGKIPCWHETKPPKTPGPDARREAWPAECKMLCASATPEKCAESPVGCGLKSCSVEVAFSGENKQVTCEFATGTRTVDLDTLPFGATTVEDLCGSCVGDAAFVGCAWSVEGLACTTPPFHCEGAGRRLRGRSRARAQRAADPRAAWFAEAAVLEARSVTAFEELARDLEALGAPVELARRARAAARDEARHAGAMARLAARHGATGRAPCTPLARPRRPRTLAELARENAVEGCVRETFGALALRARAERAEDAEVGRALGRIAADETRHAALSFGIHAWASERLDQRAAAGVARAARRELAATRARLHPHDVALLDALSAARVFDALGPCARERPSRPDDATRTAGARNPSYARDLVDEVG